MKTVTAMNVRNAALCILPTLSWLAAAQDVSVWLTTSDRKSLMQPQPHVSFSRDASPALPTVIVSDTETAQTIEGFGASMTDSAAYLLNQKVPAEGLGAVLDMLFDRTKGIGVSFLRNPMGASDLARSHYSYDDVPAGGTDADLANFSIAHDQSDILPLLRKAKAINPAIKMMGSPWSPPGWMKTSDSLIGGSLLPSAYTAFAGYLVKYVQAYEAAGVPIDYLSLQNEPLYVPADYPGCSMPAADQSIILKNYVLPALAANHLAARILVYDHNWDNPSYPQTVLADAGLAASPQIAGVAWHWYGGPPGAMTTLHNLHPQLGQFVTEASGGTWIADEVRSDFEMIIHSMRNWSKAYVKWGLALDQNRGPHAGGCGTCTGLVTVDQNTGAVTRTIDYYTLGHFSKFVLPGAVRTWSSNAPGIVSATFLNPDGTRILVVYNDSAASQVFQVVWDQQSFSYTLNSLAGATFQWAASPARGCVPASAGTAAASEHQLSRRLKCGAYTVNAAAQIQASSYNSISGLQTEPSADRDGGFDVGYSTDGGWAEYRNIDFGSGADSLKVRVASGGSGGMLEFHLTSPTGPLIARVSIFATGGWQNWITVTAPVSGAAGVQTLYVVFRQTAGAQIGNLNWFRFQVGNPLGQPALAPAL